MRRLRALTLVELSLALALGALIMAGVISTGSALLESRSHDAAYLALRSVASAVQSYGRRAGRLSALGTNPVDGADRLVDASLVSKSLVSGVPGPLSVSSIFLPTSHRVLVRASASPGSATPPDVDDVILSLVSARGAIISVGSATRPVRDASFCSGLLSLDLPALRGVMIRTAGWASVSDPLLLAPAASPSVALPMTGSHARAWSQPFTYSGLTVPSLSNVALLSDLSSSATAAFCAGAVRHPSGVMIVYALGPAPS